MRASRIAFIIFAHALFMLQPALAQPVGELESKYNSLHLTERGTFDLPESEQIAALVDKYEELFRPKVTSSSLREAEGKSLTWLFKAANLVAFYSREDRYLSDLRMILSEIEKRDVASPEQRSDFYRALIGFRRFGEARSYLSRHPDLAVEPVPAIEHAAPPGEKEVFVYGIHDREFILVERKLDVRRGTHLVVVSHPLCAFSRSVMLAVEADPDLAAPLQESLIWLAPVDVRLHFDDLQRWNRAHPAVKVHLARQRQDWPMITSWSTPQFYLLRDGALIDHFSGWRQDGSSRARLKQMLTLARRQSTEGVQSGNAK